MRLIDELNDLHATYVRAINTAISDHDDTRAEQLAREYDDDAIRLVAVREGKSHLLPIRPPASPTTPRWRLAARLRLGRAA